MYGLSEGLHSLYLDFIGTNELWAEGDGWYYKARKTTRPPLSPGQADYCQVMGPCSAGQGDCDSDSECQSELTCVEAVGAAYGFAADSNVSGDQSGGQGLTRVAEYANSETCEVQRCGE